MTLRAFLAVNIELEILKKVAKLQDQLRSMLKTEPCKVSWVPPTNMHLTMHFLGDVDQALPKAIGSSLRPVLESRSPVTVAVQGLGVFPNPGHPRVVWVGIEDAAGGLKDLFLSVEGVLKNLGFRPEDRGFEPHLTLGRVRSDSDGCISKVLSAIEAPVFGHSEISEVVIYRSDMKPTGAEYHALDRIPIGAPARGRFERRSLPPEPSRAAAPAAEPKEPSVPDAAQTPEAAPITPPEERHD